MGGDDDDDDEGRGELTHPNPTAVKVWIRGIFSLSHVIFLPICDLNISDDLSPPIKKHW